MNSPDLDVISFPSDFSVIRYWNNTEVVIFTAFFVGIVFFLFSVLFKT